MADIVIKIPTTEENREMIKKVAGDKTVLFCDEFTKEMVDDAEIILGNPSPELLKTAKNLKWLQTGSAGVEPYIKEGVLKSDCLLTNSTGAYGLAIGEFMLAGHMAMIKKMFLYRDAQKTHAWESLGNVGGMYKSTVVVLGMGDIGTEYAMRCKALGAYVIGVRRKDTTPSPYADEVITVDKLDEILPRADVLSIAMPGTPETRNMIDKRRISLMKKGAMIINVGRGYIIDMEALSDALESGHLAGAVLDVTEPEPLPKGHRLWDIPTAFITPHISGFFHLDETRVRILKIFAENLERYLKGEKLVNMIDFATGYRSL